MQINRPFTEDNIQGLLLVYFMYDKKLANFLNRDILISYRITQMSHTILITNRLIAYICEYILHICVYVQYKYECQNVTYSQSLEQGKCYCTQTCISMTNQRQKNIVICIIIQNKYSITYLKITTIYFIQDKDFIGYINENLRQAFYTRNLKVQYVKGNHFKPSFSIRHWCIFLLK